MIPAFERAKTVNALDRAATVTGELITGKIILMQYTGSNREIGKLRNEKINNLTLQQILR
jgi:hypothetical protein